MSTIHTILPVDDYARASDRFVTAAYCSDCSRRWWTVLYVVDVDAGTRWPVPSTNVEHEDEQKAREAAVDATYADNGRGGQPWGDRALRFVMGG